MLAILGLHCYQEVTPFPCGAFIHPIVEVPDVTLELARLKSSCQDNLGPCSQQALGVEGTWDVIVVNPRTLPVVRADFIWGSWSLLSNQTWWTRILKSVRRQESRRCVRLSILALCEVYHHSLQGSFEFTWQQQLIHTRDMQPGGRVNVAVMQRSCRGAPPTSHGWFPWLGFWLSRTKVCSWVHQAVPRPVRSPGEGHRSWWELL